MGGREGRGGFMTSNLPNPSSDVFAWYLPAPLRCKLHIDTCISVSGSEGTLQLTHVHRWRTARVTLMALCLRHGSGGLNCSPQRRRRRWCHLRYTRPATRTAAPPHSHPTQPETPARHRRRNVPYWHGSWRRATRTWATSSPPSRCAPSASRLTVARLHGPLSLARVI